jgi:uncharacterized membrane protein
MAGGSVKERFWEIDFLRGIAILMMIAFHLIYDLDYFGGYGFGVGSGFWFWFARATASVFLLLVGVSLTLSRSRMVRNGGSPAFSKYLKRGLRIFSWGLAITLVTWIFLGRGFIVFGVLHMIGVSVILAYPLMRHRYRNLLIGVLLIALGLYVREMAFGFPWLLWLGLIPQGFYSFDYFPLLPWFGVVLIGLFAGNSLYRDYARRFRLPDLHGSPPARALCFAGRRSLLIYLLHQPVLIALLYVLGIADIGVLQFI